MKNSVFLKLWTNEGDVWGSFKISKPKGVKILFAVYSYESYSGKAFVLFEMAGKLYEVNGSHCSCYGLEDQWQPEETTVESLIMRMRNGDLGREYEKDQDFNLDLFEFLSCGKI